MAPFELYFAIIFAGWSATRHGIAAGPVMALERIMIITNLNQQLLVSSYTWHGIPQNSYLACFLGLFLKALSSPAFFFDLWLA